MRDVPARLERAASRPPARRDVSQRRAQPTRRGIPRCQRVRARFQPPWRHRCLVAANRPERPALLTKYIHKHRKRRRCEHERLVGLAVLCGLCGGTAVAQESLLDIYQRALHKRPLAPRSGGDVSRYGGSQAAGAQLLAAYPQFRLDVTAPVQRKPNPRGRASNRRVDRRHGSAAGGRTPTA